MSIYATPILYLNLGGEMLYVLQQRLKTQKVDVDKTIQVLNDITATLLNVTVLSSMFQEGQVTVMALRPILERAALSSIMRLDASSMDKLFDLMIMMVKYQLTAVTGPKEVILLTLNHTDAMRDMVNNSTGQEYITLVHQMIVDFYSNLTYDKIWRARNDCLKNLEPYHVRISILLRLGLQNDDSSFNIISQKYNEKYEDNKHMLGNKKIKDAELKQKCEGSLQLFGDRVTTLGKNIYSFMYRMSDKLESRLHNSNFQKDCAIKAELGMLAIQLGTEESCERAFTFLTRKDETVYNTNETYIDKNRFESKELKIEKTKLNENYKNKLDNIYKDFDEAEQEITCSIDLLDLLDKIE